MEYSEKNKRQRKLGELNNVSTETLKAYLEADFNASEGERADIEDIEYITDLLLEREPMNVDVAAAEEKFWANYYPADDEKFLFDFEEDEDVAEDVANANKVVDEKGLKYSFLRYVVGVAAMFVIVLFGGTLTATALGVNPWSGIAEWTDDNFWFEQAGANQTTEFRQALSEHKITLSVVPKWLPQDYEQADSYVWEGTKRTKMHYSYTRTMGDDAESLSISVTYHTPEDTISAIYEKDATDVVTYSVGGVEHYIMYNNNCRMIVWRNGNAECLINGQFSMDEAKKMIDSIYEE